MSIVKLRDTVIIKTVFTYNDFTKAVRISLVDVINAFCILTQFLCGIVGDTFKQSGEQSQMLP